MSGIAVMRDLVSRPSGAIGLGIVLFHIVIAIIGPAIAPYDYAQQDVDAILQAPSAAHWFGTDRLGRDVFTRTLLGGREAMTISTAATIIAGMPMCCQISPKLNDMMSPFFGYTFNLNGI